MDYFLGEKPAALAGFRKALELDPSVRRQFEPSPAQTGPTDPPPAGGRGQRLRAILEDKEFLKELFPEK